MKWKSLSHVQLFVTPWTIQSMEFSRPEYWSGQPFPSRGHFPNPGIKPRPPTLPADSLPAEPQGKPKNTGVGSLSLLQWIVPTQESNLGLLHCRRILYQLSSTIIHKVRHLCYPCPCLLYAADVTIFPCENSEGHWGRIQHRRTATSRHFSHNTE